VQSTKIVSLLETYITKALLYCGGKYRRSSGKQIAKVAVNSGQKKKPTKAVNRVDACVRAPCTVRALLR